MWMESLFSRQGARGAALIRWSAQKAISCTMEQHHYFQLIGMTTPDGASTLEMIGITG
ncbi:hypothetical protein P4H46_12660 [Paenibacillus glucanolyticus]|uniref:hypothetical protein n=1 Tax=Paenibacillus glucanolyticus TaxID=59843 RepID=UPI0030C8DF3D